MVGNQQVEAPARCDDTHHQIRRLVWVGKIGREWSLPVGRSRHVPASALETARNRPADAATGTGDERNPSGPRRTSHWITTPPLIE
jgi:hypothetical protein